LPRAAGFLRTPAALRSSSANLAGAHCPRAGDRRDIVLAGVSQFLPSVANDAGSVTSVANLIVVQKAHQEVQISFWDYFKVGAPLTVLTIGVGIILLG
jgi:hypothetical protein